MNTLNTQRACFTGHRTPKLTRSQADIEADLRTAVLQAVADGKTTFITGMAEGVDLWAARIVEDVRRGDSRIKLVCAIPHPDFEARFNAATQDEYRRILDVADFVTTVTPKRTVTSYQDRNEWMVDRSSLVIAVTTGAPSGTQNTIDYAHAQGVPVVSLAG